MAKKHISSIARLTSRLHTDTPAESVLESTVGPHGCGLRRRGCDIELFCSAAPLLGKLPAQLAVHRLFGGLTKTDQLIGQNAVDED